MTPSYQKTVTNPKLLVDSMTPSAATANPNWERRRARPPAVPGMPWISFILNLGGFSAAFAGDGASTGCTAGLLTNIPLTPTPRSSAAKLTTKHQGRISRQNRSCEDRDRLGDSFLARRTWSGERKRPSPTADSQNGIGRLMRGEKRKESLEDDKRRETQKRKVD